MKPRRKIRPRRTGLPDPPPTVEGLSWAIHTQPCALDWLLPGVIPAGNMVLLQGRKGTGKSTVAAAIAAAITGGPLIPGWIGPRDRRVAWYCAEEDWDSIVLPRLLGAGAVRERLAELSYHDSAGRHRPLSLPGDCERMRASLTEGDIGILVIDPWSSVLAEGLSENSNQSTRYAYEPLLRVLKETRTTLIASQHLRKGTNGDVREHGMGSGGIVNLARIVLRCDEHPQEPGRYVLSTVSKNFGRHYPTQVYSLVGISEDLARIEWAGESDLDADSIAEGRGSSAERDEASDAERVLYHMIGTDGCIVAEIEQEAEKAGVTKKMLRSARVKLKIKTRKVGFGASGYWQWLPPIAGWPTYLIAIDAEDEFPKKAGQLRDLPRIKKAQNPRKSTKVPKKPKEMETPIESPQSAQSEEMANGQATH